MGINTRKLVDFLLVESANHAGRKNGALMATYDQLVAYGLTRSEVPAAIAEAEGLGLIHVEHGGRYNMTNKPSVFTLTFYAHRDGAPPTNDWRRVTDENVAGMKRRRRREKQKLMSKSRTTVVRKVALRSIPGGKVDT